MNTAPTSSTIPSHMKEDGFIMTPRLFDEPTCDAIIDEVTRLERNEPRRHSGIRNALGQSRALRSLALAPTLRSIIDDILGCRGAAVRSILFDKTPDRNWPVAWHQDLTIAVNRREDSLDGFGPWSRKVGIDHVQPPANILERMVTARIHLDTCDETNGPLHALAGTHTRGISSTIPDTSGARICTAEQGDVLFMHPLLWHASSRATKPHRRRVLHIEFAGCMLSPPLTWHQML